MKYIWTYIHNKNWTDTNKGRLFLLITTLLFSILGYGVWFAIHFFALDKIPWALVFTGYPGFFIGFVGGIIYLDRHDI